MQQKKDRKKTFTNKNRFFPHSNQTVRPTQPQISQH